MKRGSTRTPSFWKKRGGKGERIFLTGVFLASLCFVSVWNFATSDQKFSEEENRVLTQKPEWSIGAVLSGKFMRDYETYISDQFAGKVTWTTIKAKTEQWQGKREVNGIYLADDQYLLEKFTGEASAFSQNLTYIKEFAEKNTRQQVSLLLAPTSIEFYQDKLPVFAETASQKKRIEEAESFFGSSVNVIDIHSTMTAHKQEELFFRTDHHWTMKGAYYAYLETAETLGLKPYPLSEFSSETISTNFLGTHASKAVGFPVQPDELDVWYPKFPHHYVVNYLDTGEVSQTLYNSEHLQKRDQYSFFLDGNHSLLTIQSHVKNKRKLVVIKDSYAHVLLPFLANHYEEIHVIDLRYFHTGLEAYLSEQEIQEVLLVYNIPNFMKDSNLIWLKS